MLSETSINESFTVWLGMCIKGIVHTKNNNLVENYSLSVHVGVFCFFIEKVGPLQWMGAIRIRVQAIDKNITIIHMTPVHNVL